MCIYTLIYTYTFTFYDHIYIIFLEGFKLCLGNLPCLSVVCQCQFSSPLRWILRANLGKAVLTFSAERLRSASPKKERCFFFYTVSAMRLGTATMTALSSSINPPDSAVRMWICGTKATLECMTEHSFAPAKLSLGLIGPIVKYYLRRFYL